MAVTALASRSDRARNCWAVLVAAASMPAGRPPAFDRHRYRQRNVVERCANRLKQWRAVATRYDKRAANYRAGVVIAALLLWLEP